MDETTRTQLDNVASGSAALQDAAYNFLMPATEQPIDWVYEAWETLLNDLRHKDNKTRAIAAQVLANLAKSDSEGRLLTDFGALLAVTKDERFVTARHCLQALWKVGVVDRFRQVYLDGLAARFAECGSEKNGTLIRYDICQSLRTVYDAAHDETIRALALRLIETEPDAKYQKKYLTLWKK